MISFAQADKNLSTHLTFKGVPIDGTLNEYVLKMKNAGFTHMGTKDGIAILEGDFASYKNCTIGVSTLKQKDLVNKIAVIFPDREKWSSLSSNYFSLKEMLMEKYGKFSDCVEEFQSYTPQEDDLKIAQVRLGACKYYTTFETEKGTIQLSMEHDNVTRCYIQLIYLDKINSEIIKKEAIKDL
jgi:hypothetical protein